MRKLVIALSCPIGEEGKARVRAFSPDIDLRDVFALVGQEYKARRSGDSATLAQVSRELDAAINDAEIFFAHEVPNGAARRMPRLRWVQLLAAGVERFPVPEFLERSVTVTSGQGIVSRGIAEYVMLMVLQHAKRLPVILEQQRAHTWMRRGITMTELRNKTMGIIGLGHIGSDVAGFARAFGMRVLATRRSATTVQHHVQGVDVLYPPSHLREMLPQADYLAACVPGTPDTEGLIGDEALSLMKPTAFLINVGRGSVADIEALARALRENRLAGAALDVVPEEPLPPDSPHWDCPRLVISSHVSGHVDSQMSNAVALFLENLGRYTRDERLLNVVETAVPAERAGD